MLVRTTSNDSMKLSLSLEIHKNVWNHATWNKIVVDYTCMNIVFKYIKISFLE